MSVLQVDKIRMGNSNLERFKKKYLKYMQWKVKKLHHFALKPCWYQKAQKGIEALQALYKLLQINHKGAPVLAFAMGPNSS